MTKQIPWDTGDGNITLTYNGQGNDSVIVDSDINEDEDSREQVLTFSGGGIARQVTVIQEACPVNFRTSESDIIKTADGDYFNVAEPLPYDAEVEYLESSGTQWIDTGIVRNLSTKIRYITTIMPMTASSTTNGPRALYVGTQGYFYFGYINGMLQAGQSGAGSTGIPISFNQFYNIDVTFDPILKQMNIECNGITKQYSNFTYSNVPTNATVWLFRINNDTVCVGASRFKATKIYKNDILVMDFIPVRVGTIGYMYDKVSGQLFGNAGTGDFILGPDKTS